MLSRRQRVNRACQPCANAKVKCDDDRPCGRCRQECISAECVDRLVKIRKPRSKANNSLPPPPPDALPHDNRKKKKMTSNQSQFVTLATVIPPTSAPPNFALSAASSCQQFFQFGQVSTRSSASSAFVQSSLPQNFAHPPFSSSLSSPAPSLPTNASEFTFSLTRQISVPNDLLLQCPPRFVVFKKHWDYMHSIAQNISPLAWSDFFKNSSLFKLKAFSLLSSLYLSRPGAKEFIEGLFSFNIEALLALDPGSAEDVRCRIASVFDYPLMPQLDPPDLFTPSEDGGLDCNEGSSLPFEEATNIEFRPPAHNPELVKILNGFKFKSLPSIPPEGKNCGWNAPAMFVCNVGIDSRENVIHSTAYFNFEAEKLWGYSTRELYLSTSERDKTVREVKSPPFGCGLAPSINSLFHKNDISLFPRALIHLFVRDSLDEEAQFLRIINRHGEEVHCVAAVSYLFDPQGLPKYLLLGVIPVSLLRQHKDFHEWLSESRKPNVTGLNEEEDDAMVGKAMHQMIAINC
eukprot:TRINITY_DN1204_c0_g1_i1.p1 TRINITY_DN1204_c0_g1~~TRINITY_DN1204_c0_g1_i1.p1  ORF type:complete len:518 (-),score=105.87 TRINITY_DN1204_c0_g1_i1:885-2438(-)